MIRRGYRLLWVLFISYALFAVFPASAQKQGLGFRGLIPPPDATKKKYKVSVEAFDFPLVKTIEKGGGFIDVFAGPKSFFEDNGFTLRKGQDLILLAVPVRVEGQKILVAFTIEDAESGRKILLRNNKGEPAWWGESGRPEKGTGSQRPR